MSLLREQLVRKALAALSEIGDQCRKEPARKSLSLASCSCTIAAVSRRVPPVNAQSTKAQRTARVTAVTLQCAIGPETGRFGTWR